MTDQSLINSIVCRITEAVHPTRIYLFGSRATSNARPDSDVDLFVIYDGPMENREAQLEIRRALRDRDFSLDLIVTSTYKFERYKHVVNTLAKEVNEKGILIYG
ncbi:MAG: nucleotidyltransferase domain-containing protein [Calditrichota bacterium]